MYKYKGINDTIVAISTPAGQGGIGIVRLSGSEALKIAGVMFKSKSGRAVSNMKHATVNYGWVVKGEEIVDEVLLTVMRAPKSYTCEDVIEISCHGGIAALRSILELAVDHGARLAEPGEFTKRAFLNGRIDLTQAEAVLDIINAKTDSFLKVSSHQLKGELSTELDAIRESIMRTYTEIEAIINFPEDEIDARGRERLADDIEKAKARVEALLKTADHGKILREGIRIVICGKPNVGKSSLLNALLKTPRAIVSDIAGTTRDTIEEAAQIRGIAIQLVDTAGILEPRDLIEVEAVKRSHMHIQSADLVLFVIDASRPLEKEDLDLMRNLKDAHVLIVRNKCDLPSKADMNVVTGELKDKPVVDVSVIQKSGLETLENKIIEMALKSESTDVHGVMISNVRHIEALKRCRQTLTEAQMTIRQGTSLEFVSEHIKISVHYLDNMTGRDIDVDLIDQIFSRFCIGK